MNKTPPAPITRSMAIHPLCWLLLPGLLSLAIAPVTVVLTVIAGLLIFILPGIYLTHLFLDSSHHRFFFWATALPLGYLVGTALSICITMIVGFSPLICLTVCLLTGFPAIWQLRSSTASTERPRPSDAAATALPPAGLILVTGLCVVLLIVALLVLPYASVGKSTDSGIAYRAYYSGDYLKHVAVTAELTRGTIPPDNPYYAGEKLHYYWMFYLFPALMTGLVGAEHLEPVLKTTNLLFASVFIWLWVFTAIHFCQRYWVRLLVMLTPFCFASYEGLAVWREIRGKGWPWDGFRSHNIDGYSRWILQHPEVDTVFRLLQYNMQHIIPATLFLIFLRLFQSRIQVSRRQALIMGLICGLTIGHSGFLGSFLTLWTGLALVILGDWNRKTLINRIILGALMSIIPITALLIYKFGFQMLGSGGNPLMVTVVKPIVHHPIKFMVLNFGLALLGLPALLLWNRFHRPAIILAVLAFVWVAFIIVPDWPSDVGVKVGYTLALALTLLAGQLLDRLPRRRYVQIPVIVTIGVTAFLALPTLAMELFNSRDLENTRYVSFIDPVDWEAFTHIRTELNPSDRVQMGPGTKLNAPFSPIPTFAHRHTYCGDWMHAHIFLIPETAYNTRLDQINRIFTYKVPSAVHTLCRDAGITYLYWGANEFRTYGPVTHLLNSPELFEPVWSHVEQDRQMYLLRIR